MPTIAEKIYERGFAIGFAIGFKRGIEESKILIAKELLSLDINLGEADLSELIQRITNLSRKEVKILKKRLRDNGNDC